MFIIEKILVKYFVKYCNFLLYRGLINSSVMWGAVSRTLRPPLPDSRKLRWIRTFQISYFDLSRRHFHVSCAILSEKRRNFVDSSEAALTQQLQDYLKLADDKEHVMYSNRQLPAVQAEIPINGVIISMQNGLARVSGLRHATIGSIVDVTDKSGRSLSQGLVLFMERKIVHVALLSTSSIPVRTGMDVTLQREQLEISGSVAAFAGAVVNPLGRLVHFQGEEEQIQKSANDRIKVTWGAQSVPGVMARAPLRTPFETSLLAIDCLHPMAYGHRFGVLGPKKSGKTRVALEMIAHQVARAEKIGEQPPQIIYVCVGKSTSRIHQIREALRMTGSLSYTTIIAASDQDSPVLQYLAPFTGCAVGEYLMYNGKSPRSVVVYDDLATHTMVVEGLVQSLNLPRAAHMGLSAHAVLMERSAQFKGAIKMTDGPSLTSIVLVDAPDSMEIPSELQERVTSYVDDCVNLELSLARNRIFPPVNVLAPGASVRGPPFQSATRWTFISRLRARINAAAQVKENVEVSRKLGFEIEPEDAETLEFLELVQQFFTQRPSLSIATPELKDTMPSELKIDLGAFFLTFVDVAQLFGGTSAENFSFNLWKYLQDIVDILSRQENADIFHQLTTHSRTKAWSLELQDIVAMVLIEELEATKQRQTHTYKKEKAQHQ
ncbi:putative ATPase, F1/V1/A1 complex, alpha/beta subunit, nucleotide-binding domain-containing protein [Plasmopara halstedii]